MVYMLQVKDGVSTYRVTTLDNFFGDILSHLTYLFSFNDFVAGLSRPKKAAALLL